MNSLPLPPPVMYLIFVFEVNQEYPVQPLRLSALPAQLHAHWEGQWTMVMTEGQPAFLGPMGSCEACP